MTSPSPAYGLAARQPLALLVLLVAIAAGLGVALWLLPLGLLAYAAMVFLAARDPQLIELAQRPARPRLSSPTFRAQLDAIERTQQEIGRSATQAGGALSRLLDPISVQARELVEQAYTLCDKGQIIERYLATTNQRALQDQINGVDQRLAGTQDAYTRQQLQETRDALAERQQNSRDLETYVGRILAQLQNISASLDNVLAETVRLRTADAVSADTATNQVAQRLSDLKSDMDAFQRVLDTALSQSGAA
jgi:Type IV secretory pathway, VirB3-like protein